MKATIEIEGKLYPILRYKLKFYKEMNRDTQTPRTRPEIVPILITLPYTKDIDFSNWSLNDEEFKDVILTMIPNGLNNRNISFELYEVRCTNYAPSTTRTGRLIRKELTLYLEPGIVYRRGRELRRPWATDLSRKDQMAAHKVDVEEENSTGQINRSYFEDQKGNAVKELLEGDEVFYILNSKGLKGKKVTIDLSDSKVDFEYQGKHVKDDILEHFYVSDNSIKIPLTVVKQK